MMTEAQHLTMFGMTRVELDNMIAGLLGSREMFVMGLMSDAQHEMAQGWLEQARQTLNVAKYVQSKILEDRLPANY